MERLGSLVDRSEQRLVGEFAALVERDRRTTAAMLVYLEEIDRRQVYATEGYSSLFAWCVGRFQMSESMAGKRIGAARLSRRFPVILEMVARGELHLTSLSKISRHLTDANHRDVLGRARHKTVVELDELVAELAPKPDAATRIVPVRAPEAQTSRLAAASSAPSETPSFMLAAPPPAPVKPLSPGRYKVQLTVGRETYDKLRELQALMSHAIPGGDPAAIIDRALDVLLDKVRRQRTAAANKPRDSQARPATRTRSIPAAVRREVWARDGGACAFVSEDGHRCGETRLVQVHHIVPYARGGAATADNLALRCACHNSHHANVDYGAAFMRHKRKAPPTQMREPAGTYDRAKPSLPRGRSPLPGTPRPGTTPATPAAARSRRSTIDNPPRVYPALVARPAARSPLRARPAETTRRRCTSPDHQ